MSQLFENLQLCDSGSWFYSQQGRRNACKLEEAPDFFVLLLERLIEG